MRAYRCTNCGSLSDWAYWGLCAWCVGGYPRPAPRKRRKGK